MKINIFVFCRCYVQQEELVNSTGCRVAVMAPWHLLQRVPALCRQRLECASHMQVWSGGHTSHMPCAGLVERTVLRFTPRVCVCVHYYEYISICLSIFPEKGVRKDCN